MTDPQTNLPGADLALPHEIAGLQAYWEAAVSAFDEVDQIEVGVASKYPNALGSRISSALFDSGLSRLDRLRDDLATRLIAFACIHFGAGGTPVRMTSEQTYAVLQRSGATPKDVRVFNVARLWRCLDEEMGSGIGAALVRSEAGKIVRQALHMPIDREIERGDEWLPTMGRGTVVFHLRRVVDRSYFQGNYVDHDSVRYLKSVEQAVRVLCPDLSLGFGLDEVTSMHLDRVPCRHEGRNCHLKFLLGRTDLTVSQETALSIRAAVAAVESDPSGYRSLIGSPTG